MAKENLSIQIEYEKKEGGAVLKKLHGRCAELHIPAEIDGLPVIAVAENAFAAEGEAPPADGLLNGIYPHAVSDFPL